MNKQTIELPVEDVALLISVCNKAIAYEEAEKHMYETTYSTVNGVTNPIQEIWNLKLRLKKALNSEK